jgi:hypothetical protein
VQKGELATPKTKMTNCYKQNTTNAQTNKTTKSNIQKHLKSGTHIFANLFLMPGITPAFG